MGINLRLRELRLNAQMTQEAMGAVGGVRKQAQHLYESGERRPDSEYLERLASNGFDVLYILTGQRSQVVAPQDLLPPDERILLDNYRAAPDAVRAGIKTTLGAFAVAPSRARAKKRA